MSDTKSLANQEESIYKVELGTDPDSIFIIGQERKS